MYTQSELLTTINKSLEALTYNEEPKGMYDPIRYVLSMGGKRIRPILMLLTYNLYKDDVAENAQLANNIALKNLRNMSK